MKHLISPYLHRSLRGLLTTSLVLFTISACDTGNEVDDLLTQEIEKDEGAAPDLRAAHLPAKFFRSAAPITNHYIVVLREAPAHTANVHAAARAQTILAGLNVEVSHHYDHALKGFAARMGPAELTALLAHPQVKYIAEDGVVETSGTQLGATWGLDRIDQHALATNGNYTYHTTGAGVHAYVIDTGIRASHGEFTGRIGAGFDAVTPGGSADDCNGHGTHVAGTIGGTTYGVAKGVTLHPVRVIGCGDSGSVSVAIAGIEWVTANHVKPAVANMSIGSGPNQAYDDAVANSINAGVTYVAAAGNTSINACNRSPARLPAALTVGASTSSDAYATFSNHGSCVDIFAPGVSIKSAFIASDSDTDILDGTSMAAPHVTGVAALYLERATWAPPSTVASRIVGAASSGVLSGLPTGSPNLLLHNGIFNISLQSSSGHYLVAVGGGGSFMASNSTSIGPSERFDVADLNGGGLVTGEYITLRASNGSYVVAENSGGDVVNINRWIASSWERFRLINLDPFWDFYTGDHVALQADNGQYLVAENGGGQSYWGSVNANRSAVGAWETFVITVH